MKLEQSSISIHAHNMGSLHSNSAVKMYENTIIITATPQAYHISSKSQISFVLHFFRNITEIRKDKVIIKIYIVHISYKAQPQENETG